MAERLLFLLSKRHNRCAYVLRMVPYLLEGVVVGPHEVPVAGRVDVLPVVAGPLQHLVDVRQIPGVDVTAVHHVLKGGGGTAGAWNCFICIPDTAEMYQIASNSPVRIGAWNANCFICIFDKESKPQVQTCYVPVQ